MTFPLGFEVDHMKNRNKNPERGNDKDNTWEKGQVQLVTLDTASKEVDHVREVYSHIFIYGQS